eukprot:SAG31_NODE_801_length_12013_cov_23.812070_10_plen_73_part_00
MPILDKIMNYVIDHTNTSNGWIGPYANEPGDRNGHGLWDPLNMIRSLMMCKGSYFLVFVPTIREIRDFYREM